MRHIDRLTEVFGKTQFPKLRTELLWKEVGEFSEQWFESQCDYFMRKMARPDFDEAISIERDRQYEIEKRQHRKEAEEFMSSYSAEDIKTICLQIKERLQGKMSDSEFDSFKKAITPPEKFKCQNCEDTGVFTDNLGGITLCHCRNRK